MADQWPRALLRAELLEAGYDAIGARSLEEGLALVSAGTDRGPFRLVVVDQAAVESMKAGERELADLGTGVTKVLVGRAGGAPSGPWDRVLHRPVSVGDIVSEVRACLPLAGKGIGTIE